MHPTPCLIAQEERALKIKSTSYNQYVRLVANKTWAGAMRYWDMILRSCQVHSKVEIFTFIRPTHLVRQLNALYGHFRVEFFLKLIIDEKGKIIRVYWDYCY